MLVTLVSVSSKPVPNWALKSDADYYDWMVVVPFWEALVIVVPRACSAFLYRSYLYFAKEGALWFGLPSYSIPFFS